MIFSRTSKLLFPLAAALTCSPLSYLRGATLVYSASIPYSWPNSFTGSTSSFAVTVPQLPSSTGTLTGVSLSFTSVYQVEAIANLQGGTFITPYWYASYDWDVNNSFAFAGPGLTVSKSETSQASGSLTSNVLNYSVNVLTPVKTTSATGSISQGNSSLASYAGTGSVTLSFAGQLSSAIPPLPATLAGFTFFGSPKVVGAVLDGAAQSDLTISYSYVPRPAPLPGDANLNGRIDPDDFALIDRGFAKGLLHPTWSDGDFDGNGVVNSVDYLIINQSFAAQSGSHDADESVSVVTLEGPFRPDVAETVPEPAGLLAMTLMAACAARRRFN